MGQTTTKKKPGPVAGNATIKASVMLDPDLLEWGKHQPGGLSATLRRLLREAREQIPVPDSDEYWIRKAQEGRDSGYIPADEAMRRIQEHLDREESLTGQA